MKTLQQIGDQAYHLLHDPRVEDLLLKNGWEYWEDCDIWEMFEGDRDRYEDWMDDQLYRFDDADGRHWYFTRGARWR